LGWRESHNPGPLAEAIGSVVGFGGGFGVKGSEHYAFTIAQFRRPFNAVKRFRTAHKTVRKGTGLKRVIWINSDRTEADF